jgi:hypothetical protein
LTSVCAMSYFLHHAFVFLLGTNHFFHWKQWQFIFFVSENKFEDYSLA